MRFILFSLMLMGVCQLRGADTIEKERFLFETLSIEDGLSSDFVISIEQDHQGFLWFVTRNGLNRYDGQSVVSFFRKKDSPYHPDFNWYHHSFVDHEGRLWLGRFGTHTDAKSTLINWYNPEMGTFEDVEQLGQGEGSDLHMDMIDAIETDTDGMYITGSRGLQYWEYSTQVLSTIWPKVLHRERISTHNVSVNYKGELWVGTGGDGIVHYDPVSDRVRQYTKGSSPFFLPSDDIYIVEEFDENSLWFSETGSCMSRLDVATNKVREMTIAVGGDENNRTTKYFAQDLIKDSKGRIWLGTLHNGLHILNPDTGRFDPFSVSHRDMHPHYFRASVIFEDRDGTLWVGTETYGILKVDSYKTSIGVVRSLVAHGEGEDAPIWEVVAEDSVGNFWAGSESSGVFKFDRELRFLRKFEHDPMDPSSIHHNRATRLLSDPRGYMWVGTAFGASRINVQTDELERITPDLKPGESTYSRTVDVMYQDERLNVWIAQQKQLAMYDDATGSVVDLPPEIAQAASSVVDAIEMDGNGHVWLGTSRGIIVFDPKTNELVPWDSELKDPLSQRDESIESMLYDSKGRMWIVTKVGIVQYKFESHSFVFYDVRRTLSTGLVYGLAEDKWGQIWATTHKGVVRYVEEEDRFADFRKIETELGMPLDRIGNSNTGKLILSNLTGIVLFDPGRFGDLSFEQNEPPIYITRVIANGSNVPFGPALPVPEVVLSPGGNSLSVDFSLLDYRYPEKTVFSYRIEELDEDWVYSNRRNNATYNQLPTGRYTFKVKGAGRSGKWSDEVAMQVLVLPYYWQTVWFRGLAVVIGLGIVVFIHRYRTLQIRRRNQNLKEQVEFRKRSEATLRASEAQALSSKIAAEHSLRVAEAASEAKSLFLANMSHEIRTPLNAITGMADLMRIKDLEHERESFLDTIRSSSHHLLSLVEDILNYTQLESEKVKVDIAPCLLHELVAEVASIVRPDAIRKKIKLTTQVGLGVPEIVMADAGLLKQILLNLASNAVKYTPEGFVLIEAKLLEQKGRNVSILFSILDSGVGIADESKARIFKIFEQEDASHTRVYGGVGLGLSIVEKLTNLLGGEISLDSTKGEGSRFSVKFQFDLPDDGVRNESP